MNEQLKGIIDIWQLYWGTGFTQYLFLISVLYLILRAKKIKQSYLLIGYVLLGLFLFFFPLTAKMIHVCIGEGVYWRYIWIMPTTPLIALALADLCSITKKGMIHIILVIVSLLVLVQSGELLWETDIFTELNNLQKVPNVVADTCMLIQEDAGEEQIILITDTNISSFARVYNPAIIMPFGREGRGAEAKEDNQIYQMIYKKQLKAKTLLEYAEKKGANYLVLPDECERTQLKYIERHGFHVLNTVENYIIYAKDE